MKVIRVSQVPKEPSIRPIFIGGPVTQQLLVKPQQMGKDFTISITNFSKGVRTKFHSHTRDQVLMVTAGKGIVATEDEQRVVEVGDIIHNPAGEKHWHGATKDSEFSHLCVLSANFETTLLED